MKTTLFETLNQKFQSSRKRLQENSNETLDQIRNKAQNALSLTELPGAKSEEYKYVNFSKALDKKFDFTKENHTQNLSAQDLEDFTKHIGEDVLKIVFVNGQFSEELSSINTLPQGVQVQKVSDVLKNDPEKLTRLLATETNVVDEFEQLNTLLFEEGIVLEVAKNTMVTPTVYLEFVNDNRSEQSFNSPRNFVTIAESSELKLVENHRSVGNNTSFTNIATDVFVGANAHLKYYKIQNDSTATCQVDNTTVYQDKDSVATTVTISLDGKLIRNNLNFVLNGSNILANMYGLSLLNNDSIVDNHTTVDHKQPHCDSNELYKGVYGDKSKGIFNGKIFVRQIAQKTNAFQSNKNILLSDDASINTKPQLEIWADDVKCSHGCTNGQLDEEQLFYLRARGVGEEKARAMLLYAFADDVIEHISLDPLKAYLESIIEKRFQ